MESIWSNLPAEIVGKILWFSCSPQPKLLLEDIESFHQFEARTTIYYHTYWILMFNSRAMEDRHWLINDMILFLNGFAGTNYRYDERYLFAMKRLYKLQRCNNLDIVRNIENMYFAPVNQQIKVVSGLLTPDERNHFLKDYC